MTVLITNDHRAIDFKDVRIVFLGAGPDAEPWVCVQFNGSSDAIRLFSVAGHRDEEISLLIARVVSHCMRSTADVALEDVIIKEWHYAMYPHKGEKNDW